MEAINNETSCKLGEGCGTESKGSGTPRVGLGRWKMQEGAATQILHSAGFSLAGPGRLCFPFITLLFMTNVVQTLAISAPERSGLIPRFADQERTEQDLGLWEAVTGFHSRWGNQNAAISGLCSPHGLPRLLWGTALQGVEVGTLQPLHPLGAFSLGSAKSPE